MSSGVYSCRSSGLPLALSSTAPRSQQLSASICLSTSPGPPHTTLCRALRCPRCKFRCQRYKFSFEALNSAAGLVFSVDAASPTLLRHPSHFHIIDVMLPSLSTISAALENNVSSFGALEHKEWLCKTNRLWGSKLLQAEWPQMSHFCFFNRCSVRFLPSPPFFTYG